MIGPHCIRSRERASHSFKFILAAWLALAVTIGGCGLTESDGRVTFLIRVANVSTDETLMLPDGMPRSVPLSPGIWVVHDDQAVLFEANEPDRGQGLESIAEDGDPSPATVFRPLAEVVLDQDGVTSAGVFDTPVDAEAAALIGPEEAYEFRVMAREGERLTLVTKFIPSNDLFFAPVESGIELFEEGRPVSGDRTEAFVLWDLGTEVNEPPGAGPNQADRQPEPNTGPDENGTVRLGAESGDGFTYPAVADVLSVTITPVPEPSPVDTQLAELLSAIAQALFTDLVFGSFNVAPVR